jgi:segregation and condensation protein A
LEMYRDQAVAFDQAAPLADLLVRWSAAAEWSAQDMDEEYDAGAEPAQEET